MIAAIYARKSTGQNVSEDAKSVVRQVDNARAFAVKRGWTVAEDHVYVDDAISGAETLKLQAKNRMLETLRNGRPPFDVLVMQSSDRLSRRDGAEAFVELKSIAKTGVQVWFYATNERFTYGDLGSNLKGYVQAEFNAQFRRSIAEKTTEAMLRKARAGHVCGGKTFGYTNMAVTDADGRRSHVDRQINEPEAAVILRMFTLCARGQGKTSIAKQLNAEGAPAPRPRSPRGDRRPVGWSASTVFEALHRQLYRGVIVYNRSKKRDEDGECKWLARPREDWIEVPAPHLRIVPEELWLEAHRRLDERRAVYLHTTGGKLWGKPSNPVAGKYLVTGHAVCGDCGGAIEIEGRVHGSRGHRRRVNFCICSTHRRRGAAICPGLSFPMAVVDAAVRKVIESVLLNPRVLEEACSRLLEEPLPAADTDAQRAELLKSKAALDRELRQLTDALATLGQSRAVLDAIAEREAALARIERALQRQAGRKAVMTPERVRRALDACLRDWIATLHAHAPLARQLLAKVLDGRMILTAETCDDRPGVRIRGRARADQLLSVVFSGDHRVQTVASPRGADAVYDFDQIFPIAS